MKEEIPVIRVTVPEEFGTAYDGEDGRQWVERRQRISGKLLKALDGVGAKVSDEEAFPIICQELGKVILDWNLEGDGGPLPKPHKNKKAFEALFDSDFSLLMWVASLPFLSMARLLEQADSKN